MREGRQKGVYKFDYIPNRGNGKMFIASSLDLKVTDRKGYWPTLSFSLLNDPWCNCLQPDIIIYSLVKCPGASCNAHT